MAIDLGFLAQAGMRGLTGYRQGQRLAREDEQEEARNLFAEWARRQQLALQGRAIDVDQQRLNMPPTPRTQAVQGPDGNYTVIDLNRVGPTGVSGRVPNPPAPLRGQVVQDASGKYVVVDPTKIGPTGVAGRLPAGAQGGAPRPLTEEQAKSHLYAGLMASANEELNALEGKIDTRKVTSYITSRFFKPALTAEEQQYVRAARDFAAGVLRKESGAAVTDQELKGVFDRYIAAGLDAPETIAAKRRAREEHTARMRGLVPPDRVPGQRRPLDQIIPPE